MKKLLFLLAICLASSAFSQVPNYVPSNGLIGYWPFNGNANDESGNGNNGMVNGATPTTDRFGAASSAYDFDGSDFIQISNSTNLNFTQGTINIWFRTSQTNFMSLVERNIFSNASNENWALAINQTTFGDLSLYTKHNSSCLAGTGWQTNLINQNLSPSDWHMLTGVIKSGTTEVYYDGLLVNTFNTPSIMDVCGGDIQIARHWLSDPRYFSGKLDDLGIWNRVLTQQEVSDLYNSTASSTCIEVSPSADTLCAGESTTLTASFSDSRWQNYYFEDFELGASSEWSSSSTFSYEGSQLLGRYGNNNIALNLSNLPAHDSVRVEFDLFIGDTWDGYSLLGGSRDIWRLRFNGDTIINATFAACCGSAGVGNGGQSYPDNIPAVNPATTGAFALDLPDFVGSGDGTDLYKVSRSSDYISSSLTVEFSAQDLQGLSDESWAIDNVRVYLYSSDVVNDVIWSTGDTALSITVSPSTTTTYYATLDDGLSLCLDSAVVTLSNQPPIITCLTDITTTSSTDGTGDCSTTVVIGNPGVSDDCDVPVLTAEINGSVVDVNTYAFPVGTTTITWIAADGQGLADTCYQDIVVNDDEDPVLLSCPLGIQVDNDPGDCGAIVTFVEPVFSDNCSFQVNSPALGSGSFFPIGLTNLTYTAIDPAGNQQSCTVAIIVDDVELPVFQSCPGDTTISTSSLSCSASFSFPSAIVSDNCPNTSLQQLGLPSGANFPLGSSVVTFIVNDTSGNLDTCSFTVTVVDLVAPYFTSCPSDISIELGTQSCDTVISWVSLSAFDNCSATITQIDGLPNGSVFPVGTTLNRFVVTDNAGNTDTCSFTVTVTDNKSPVIVCPPPTIVNNVGSNCGPQVINYSLPTSTDNCVTVTTTRIAGPASGSAFPVGTTTVTYVASDNVGNTDTCSFTVTINDPLPPPASVDTISGPIEMCRNTSSFYSVSPTSNATDYFWTVIGGTINSQAVGTNSRNKQITWQTTGIGIIIVEAVNTCYGSTPDTLEVMVYDNPSPVNAGLDSTTLCSPVSSYTLQATPPAIGNGVWSVVLGGGTIASPNSPTSLVTGLSTDSNLFRWTVTNAICTRTDSIYVIPDNEAPTATCQDITRYLPAAGFINVTLSEVNLTTADNCAVDSVWLVQSVFTCVDLGTATAEVIVSDSFGNLGGCTANVTLIDTIKPTAVCQDITVVLNSIGEYTLNAQEVNGGSFDNCSLDSVYIDRSFFTCTDTGIRQVMLTVVDLAGYSDSCIANVTVLDTAGPTINGCADRTVFLDSSGVVVVDPNTLFLSIPNDPCGLASITTGVNQNIFTCEDVGPNSVVVTATDNNGNQSTCSSTVTVVDNIAPLAVCSDINVTLDSSGSYTITNANVFDAGSYDACGITTWIASPTTFTCSDTGSNIVTVTIYDSLLNTSTCTPSVNVSSNFSSTLDTTVCGGIVWNGTYYDSAGTYTYNTSSVTGCDSVALLNLTLYPAFTVSDSARGCDSVVVNGNVYFSSQVVVDSFVTVDGCDSVVTTDVIIDTTRYGVDVKAICNSYTWVDGQTYTASTNTPTFTYTADNGCDSIVTLNLTILRSTSDSVSATACDSFTWNGTTYYQSGGYTYQTQNAVGCDSTATLLLTINNPTSSTTSISACNDYTWNGVTYQQSGTYSFQTQNANGCDSVATLVLTINSPTSSQESVTACDSFTWNGVTYQQSGTYNYQTQNANGCDSTATLNLTINNSTSSQESVTACDSYPWNGVTYQQSGTYTYQTQNAVGCDSTATLVLTINSSTSSQESVTVCDSYQWNGVTYQQSGTYTYQTQNANGCDSNATLNLTINSSNSGVEVASACESYTWIDGNTYLSDTFGPTFTLSNASGCDSVVTLDLTIRNTSSSIDTVTYCGVYTWEDSVQYSTDTFGPAVTYTNAEGCDSVVTLFLTIEPLNTVISVTQAFTLSADQNNGTYQWIDCNNNNAPIPGETNQSYSPVETGLYAVIIMANGCTDTSACVSQQGSGVGILESTLPSEVYLYPNPFADELHLELGQYYESMRLVMYDMIGQTIYSQQYNGVDRIDPTMDVAAGTYTLRLEDDKGRYAMFRIVRKR